LETVAMNPAHGPQSAARAILDSLGVAEDPLIGADPVSFLRSLAAAGAAMVKNPTGLAGANARLLIGSVAAMRATAGLMVGQHSAGPASPAKGDKRFGDPAFERSPLESRRRSARGACC
jgi:hypothetical protein